MQKINICVLTYQRVGLLLNCLTSLEEMLIPDDVLVTVTIIDNDPAQQDKGDILSKLESMSLETHYISEPSRGIPIARNTAIEFSHEINADYIVFIDDDEWVEEQWFCHLYNYCQEQGGEVVVSGNVIPIFPNETPAHITKLIKIKNRPTGTSLVACATNNVIFPVKLTKDMNLRFDESVPLAGGTDTLFFTEATRKGVCILYCAQAVVYEKIPESRANLRWMSHRKYRVGITYAVQSQQRGKSKLRIFFTAVVKILVNIVAFSMFSVLINKFRRNSAWLKLCKSCGVISGLRGVSVDSY